MWNKGLRIGVSLAWSAGLLLIGSSGWAQATKTPIAGVFGSVRVLDPGKQWVDEDGVLHVRNYRYRLRSAGDIFGFQVCIGNFNVANRDPVLETADVDQSGSCTMTGQFPGSLATARLRYAGVCSGQPSVCEVDSIWHLDDGRVINMTEMFTWYGGGDWDWTGTILDPPGRN